MNNTMMLPVVLTADELAVRSEELSNLYGALEMDGLTDKISELARVVRTRKEDRPVEVRDMENYDRMTMETIRLDTGEVVGTRPLKGDERIPKLFGGRDIPQRPAKDDGGDGEVIIEFPAAPDGDGTTEPKVQ